MTHTQTPTPPATTPQPAKAHPTRRRLGRLRRTIGFALIRGAAQATGNAIVGLLLWWITHR
jgi:hypothetical protein